VTRIHVPRGGSSTVGGAVHAGGGVAPVGAGCWGPYAGGGAELGGGGCGGPYAGGGAVVGGAVLVGAGAVLAGGAVVLVGAAGAAALVGAGGGVGGAVAVGPTAFAGARSRAVSQSDIVIEVMTAGYHRPIVSPMPFTGGMAGGAWAACQPAGAGRV
jgi:hypothetical protein